jgi:hypothetical protein
MGEYVTGCHHCKVYMHSYTTVGLRADVVVCERFQHEVLQSHARHENCYLWDEISKGTDISSPEEHVSRLLIQNIHE